MRLEAELAYLNEIQTKATVIKADAPTKRETTKKEKNQPQSQPQAPVPSTAPTSN